MDKQELIFLVQVRGTQAYIDQVKEQVDKCKSLIDGFNLNFFVVSSEQNDIKCIYPTFVGDAELMQLQKQNMKILNELLKDKFQSKEKISVIKRIFRYLKIKRINEEL
jgi:hypothetical protein